MEEHNKNKPDLTTIAGLVTALVAIIVVILYALIFG